MPSVSGRTSRLAQSECSRRPRVIIADDHAIVAEGLRRLLDPPCDVVAVVGDGLALVDAVRRLRPDLVVTDLSMPRCGGAEAIRKIKRRSADVRIICLSMHADRTWLHEALQAGADGYVVKHGAAEELLDAIAIVRHGQIYVSPVLERHRPTADEGGHRPRDAMHGVLTPRQRQVLQLVSEGRSLRQIAEQLNLSSKTVEFHKDRIKAVLGLDTTAQLIQYAVRHGIVAE